MKKKRVLHIINSLLSGGAERLILDLVPRINQKNMICDVLVLSKIDEDEYIVKELKAKGINLFSLNSSSIYSLLNIFKLRKYLKNYDVIHSHLFPTQYWVSMCKCLFRFDEKLFVTTEHNTHNRRRDIKIFEYIDKFIYNQYDSIISISNSTQRKLEDYLPSLRHKYIVIDNGVDLGRFQNISDKDFSDRFEGKKVLCQVAGFRIQKDQDTLIRALSLLPPKFVVAFAGAGDRIKFCQELAKEEKVQDRVFFLGQISNIPSLIAKSSLVVISSHWEGFGLVAVEGMACGKPVIASNVEGLASVVEGAGILFEKGNYKQLAKIITELDESELLYQRVAKQCYDRSKEYDIEIMVEKVIQLYN